MTAVTGPLCAHTGSVLGSCTALNSFTLLFYAMNRAVCCMAALTAVAAVSLLISPAPCFTAVAAEAATNKILRSPLPTAAAAAHMMAGMRVLLLLLLPNHQEGVSAV